MRNSRIPGPNNRQAVYLLALKMAIVFRYAMASIFMGARAAILSMAKTIRQAFDSVFHWKYPGVLVGIFVGAALGMFTLGQGAHSRFLVHLGFGVAYLFLVLAVIWGIGAWIKSEHWQKSHPGQYPWDKANIKSYRRSQWIGSVGIFVIFLIFVLITALFHVDKLSSLPDSATQALPKKQGPVTSVAPTPTPTPSVSPTPIQEAQASPSASPSPTRIPAHIRMPVYVPPPKSESSPTPSVGARLGTGSDSYKDISDEQLAVWAKDEADKIEQLAKDSMNNNWVPANARTWRFTHDFQDCCTQDVKDLRAEILRRLGPPAKDSDEIQAWTIMFSDEKYPLPNAPNTINPMSVEFYAPYLRRLALRLQHRVKPRVPPESLKFTQVQIQPQQGFTSTIMATIQAETPVLVGYIVVDFEGHPASISCDFKDSELFYPSDPRMVDDRELNEHLATTSKGAVIYALKIGKTPFTTVHVFASGAQAFSVRKVTLYHE